MTSVFAKNMTMLALLIPVLAEAIGAEIVAEEPESKESLVAVATPDVRQIQVMLGLLSPAAVHALLVAGCRLCLFEINLVHFARLLRALDVAQALSSGQLSLHYVPETNLVLRELSVRQAAAALMQLLRQDRGIFWHLQSPLHDAYALIAQAVRRQIEKSQILLQVPVAHIPAYDVIVLNPRCAIFADLAQCFANLGLRTHKVDVPDVSQTLTEEQRYAVLGDLRRNPARLLITRNRVFLESEDMFDVVRPELLLGQPHLAWWWDTPNPASFIDLFNTGRGCSTHLAFARDLLTLLPEGSQWLSAGARTCFVNAPTLDNYPELRYPISFVGQTRLPALQQYWNDMRHTLSVLGFSALSRLFEPHLSDSESYYAVFQQLENMNVSVQEAVERCALLLPVHGYYLSYLWRMLLTGLFRLAAVEQVLAQGYPLYLWGDADWFKVPGVTNPVYQGVLSPDSLSEVYRHSGINLNLNFMQVSSTVNPKVLDCAAAGGLVLTDWRPELDILYPDPAVRPISFRTIPQLLQRMSHLLTVDTLAHRRALQHHTRTHHTLRQRAWRIAHSAGLL